MQNMFDVETGFKWTHFIVGIVVLLFLMNSMCKQSTELKVVNIEREKIAETSQNFFINLVVMFIVLIYKICVFKENKIMLNMDLN